MKTVLASLLALTLAPGVAAAQSRIPAAFLGSWVSLGLNPAESPLGAPKTELPYAELDKRLGEFMQPWAIAEHDALEWNTDDTGQICRPDGIFRQGVGTGAGNFRFVDRGDALYQVWSSTDERGFQRIYLNAPRPRTIPLTWNGDSRGRFEGTDTLIVDTSRFNNKGWLSSDRWAHSEELRVVERYRLYGGGAFIQVRVFIDDRRSLKEPFTFTRYYRKVAEPTEGGESVCNQNAPEDDLWAQRRDKLLDEHDAKLTALMARYANETLPQGPAPQGVPAGPVTSAADAAKLRAISGVFDPMPANATLPTGLRRMGMLSELPVLASARTAASSKDLNFDPAKHCMVVGPFRMMARDDARFEVITSGNRVTLLFENTALGNRREIYLGRTAHAARAEPSYHGDSIARWDGDTLVVDTVGFNGLTWLNDTGVASSEGLHLVERIRPVQGGRYLEYQVTAEDPMALSRAYSYTRVYQRSSTELQEDFCETR